MTVRDTLLDLEHALWTGGADLYRRTLTDDALLVVPYEVLDKQRTVQAIAAGDRWQSCAFEDVGLVELGPDAAVLTYRATAGSGDSTYRALVSSAYVRRSGRWLLATHHQTPMP